MKKLSWITLSLMAGLSLVSLFVALAAPSAFAAPERQTGEIDPEPPINLPRAGTGFTPETIQATLEPGWTSPNSDFTNQLVWGDYDRDGDLDLLAGNSGENRLYQNNGNPTMPNLTEIMTLVCQSAASDTTQSVDFGDYDQDGDLDIAIGNANNRNCVLQNNNGNFDLAWLADVTLDTRSVAFAGWEYNGVFDMYLAIGNASEPTNVYRYEGGTFDLWWTETNVYATNVVAWGDFDNDGDPDLVLGNFGQSNRIYRNNGNTLTLFTVMPDTFKTRDLAWGDMNGDGYLDLAEGNGQSLGNSDPDRVYCNSGPPDFTFTSCWVSTLAVSTYNVAWGDYEGDGDLDLALSSENDGETRIYENSGGTLSVNPIWDANDESANSRAVTWADWNGDGDLEFAIGYSGAPIQLYENTVGAFVSTSFGPDTYDARSVAWGDWDNDGDLDLAVGNSSSAPSLVYENNDGVLSLAFTTPLLANTRSVAWGDYDGDGDLDLALGNGATASGQANRLYENVGGTLFLSGDFFDPAPADTFSIAWGDYDGDGDLDLAAGNFGSTQPVYIHVNENGQFSQVLAIPGTASFRTLSLAWGDFDQDFDLDLVVGNDDGPNYVLMNNGGGSFTALPLPEPAAPCTVSPGSDTWSVAWGDYDGDGDLDIAAGHAGSSGCFQVIQSAFSGSAWTFTTVYQSTDASLDVRAAAWGDWDGDGDLDLALGVSGSFGRRNRIHRNDGNNVFTLAWRAPTNEADPTRDIAWGDMDNDGDLDLASANGLSPAYSNRVYRNNWKLFSGLPNDPIQVEVLRSDGTGNAYFFSTAEIQGQPTIWIPFTLADDEGDMAYLLEFQVSWNGGGSWEPACQAGEDCQAPSGGWQNVPTIPGGERSLYFFPWNALYQLLAHQNLTLNVDGNQYPAFEESQEEMDVAFRIVAWSNPYHGGLIQRPSFGNISSLSRVDMRPDWSSALKLHSPEYGTPGEILHYTIVITQADHGMPPAYILDELPQFLTLDGFPTSTNGAITATGQVITWTNFFWDWENSPLFPWGQRVDNTDAIEHPNVFNLNFDALITRPLTNGLVITNTALIFDGLHAPFTIVNTVTITSSPTLSESWKLVNGLPENFAAPGELMTYTIILTNTGTENAYGVTMADVLPDEVNFAGSLSASSGNASFGNGTVTWQGDVRVFEPVHITFTVNVDLPLIGTFFTNTFELQHSSIITPFISTPVTTTVLAPNFLPSFKTANTDFVELGDVLTYTIVIENIGLTDAYSVTLNDPMPGASAYVPGSFQASAGTGAYNPNTRAIEWSSPLVEIGTPVTLTFAVTVGLPAQPPNAILTNTATLADPLSGSYALVHTATVFLPDFDPSYKTGSPNQITLGDVVTYTLIIENEGGRSPDTTLSDPIPGGSTYVPGSLSASAGTGTYNAGADRIEWSGDVAHGDVITLTFAITTGAPIPRAPVITNTATLVDDVGFETLLVAVTDILPPDLSSSYKTGTPNLVELGDLLTYTIHINNTGANGPGLALTDPITDGLTYSAGSFTSTVGTGGYNAGTNAVYWTGDLDTGESADVQFAVVVGCPITGSMFTNQAWLVDSVGAETLVSASTFVYLPDFSDSILSADLNRIGAGSLLTYRLTIRNTGGNAPFASMSTLPLAGQAYVTSSATTGTMSYNPVTRVVSWNGALSTAQEVFITIQVLVTTSGGGVSLTAEVNTGCTATEMELTIPGGAIYLPIVVR